MLTEKEIEDIVSSPGSERPRDDVESLQPQSELNSELWAADVLKDRVRDQLHRIALEFYLSLNVEAQIKDIIFTGSLANYNYTKHSDIDLHVLVDYADIDENVDLVRDFLTAKKSLWNDKHDIKFTTHEVELYAQDENEPHHSTGVYSIVSNKWLAKPSPKNTQIDYTSVRAKATNLMSQIDDVVLQPNSSIKKIRKLKDKIKRMRQSGLEKSGEYSIENLAFKVLRNTEYIKKLYDRETEEFDKNLSLSKSDLSIESRVYERVLKTLLGTQNRGKRI
jgi:hypothetical protein